MLPMIDALVESRPLCASESCLRMGDYVVVKGGHSCVSHRGHFAMSERECMKKVRTSFVFRVCERVKVRLGVVGELKAQWLWSLRGFVGGVVVGRVRILQPA